MLRLGTSAVYMNVMIRGIARGTLQVINIIHFTCQCFKHCGLSVHTHANILERMVLIPQSATTNFVHYRIETAEQCRGRCQAEYNDNDVN